MGDILSVGALDFKGGDIFFLFLKVTCTMDSALSYSAARWEVVGETAAHNVEYMSDKYTLSAINSGTWALQVAGFKRRALSSEF
jgi:hypothetical protein